MATQSEQGSNESRSGSVSLMAAALAALLASACCLGPLALVLLGVSGAWIGNLTALEPYRPFFIGGALIAMFFAWRHIYRAPRDCGPDELCAVPRVKTAYKVLFWCVVVMIVIALFFPYMLALLI